MTKEPYVYVLVAFIIGDRVVKVRKMEQEQAIAAMKAWSAKGIRFRVTSRSVA